MLCGRLYKTQCICHLRDRKPYDLKPQKDCLWRLLCMRRLIGSIDHMWKCRSWKSRCLVCVYGCEVGRLSFNMLNGGEVVVECHNWASQGLFYDHVESACGGWDLFSVLGKMELIRIDDAMWKLVEMWVCVWCLVRIIGGAVKRCDSDYDGGLYVEVVGCLV